MAGSNKWSEWKQVEEKWERSQKATQRRILAIPGARRDLDTLVRAGANEKKILDLLSLVVITDSLSWRKPLRGKQKELESIANQLETVANHAERIALDYLSYGTLWLAILGVGDWKDVSFPKKCAPRYIFRLMRLYAKNCRDKAKQFGTLLRTHPKQERHQKFDFLLAHVWQRTGNYYDKEIAQLLTDAHEAVGSKQQFTEGQIKKHRQRYLVPLIRKRQKATFAAEGFPPATKKGTTHTL